MDDNDNLPVGTSFIEANNAGVSRFDDSQFANAKLHTYRQEQGYAQQREWAAEAALKATSDARGQNTPSGGTWFPGGGSLDDAVRVRGYGCSTASHLASVIESERRNLVYQRKKSTITAEKMRKVAIFVVAITAVIVFLGIKMPFISYRHVMAEYLTGRLLLVAAIFVIFKTSSVMAKSVTAQEKRLVVLGQCLVDAFRKSYVEKVKKNKGTGGFQTLLGEYDVPNTALTAGFLFAFNQRMMQKTGAAMPYGVFRLRARQPGENGLYVSFTGALTELEARVADLVSLEDLRRLSAEPV